MSVTMYCEHSDLPEITERTFDRVCNGIGYSTNRHGITQAEPLQTADLSFHATRLGALRAKRDRAIDRLHSMKLAIQSIESDLVGIYSEIDRLEAAQ